MPGGAGYIGSHTFYALIEKDYDLVIVDNLLTGFLQLIHPEARFYRGDARYKDFLNNVSNAEKIDGVIHFCANSLVGTSMKDPLDYYNNNLYGETKLAMEKLMHWCDRSYGITRVALRYFNTCGAHENGLIGELHNPETHPIPLVLQTAPGKRDAIKVYGDDYDTPDGTCIRDYIHVNDLADTHIKSLNYRSDGNNSDVFNLGNGSGYSVMKIINTTKAITKLPIHVTMDKRRAGDPARLVANNSKAATFLKWRPQYTQIEKIIETAWNFYNNNLEKGDN